ncbi:probable receptor-like protein kinase At2g21480 [Miscanthus floridulus]|uniref:probable receptor-like protein kinase At2g21480 n=1 Tax=Miscanthus floridulus TaxID=154761 RepID=UPI0034573E41
MARKYHVAVQPSIRPYAVVVATFHASSRRPQVPGKFAWCARTAADDKADVPSPLYATARVFKEEAVYSFPFTVPGWHFIRIYLFPIKACDVDLTSATFSVVTDDNVLLHSFTPENKPVMKEYVINATENHLALKFQPLKGSATFVNAIEVVNAPDELITDSALAVAPLGEITGVVHDAYQVLYRINVGGPTIGPANDTLGRRWETDAAYVQTKEAVKDVSVPTSTIKFPDGTSRLVAPTPVYASAAKMADADVGSPNFNLTWKVDVDPSFSYLVRLFFSDIVSKATNDLYFDVYISGRKAVSGLDLSTVTGGELAAPYYKDFVVNSSSLEGADGKGKLSVQVVPMGQDTGRIDALLNGIEVLKMSNSVGSLDGEFGVDMGFSSWLLPIHTGQSFTASGKGGYGSHKSGNTFSSTMGLGRFFSFVEIQMLSKLRHRHLVSLIGYCDENQEMIFLQAPALVWPCRDHGACCMRRLRTWSLSSDPGQLHVAGTCGFIAPEYSVGHKASRETHVFVFGALMLEVVTGQLALRAGDLRCPLLSECALSPPRRQKS